jgi:DNA polymerase IV
VVDKDYEFELIMKLLKPMMKNDSIPPHIVLVNDDYPIDCMDLHVLVDEKQLRYHVKGLPKPVVEEAEGEAQAMKSRALSKVSARKSKKHQETPEEETQQSESQSQPSRPDSVISSPEAGLPTDHTDPAARLESPRERSPILDIDFTDGSELGKMINLVQEFGNLPLDDDEEEGEEGKDRDLSNDFDPDYDGSSEEEHRPRQPRKKKHGKKKRLGETEYICMRGGTGNIIENNPNCKTIEILERMKEYYERVQDQWRSLAYRRAIGILKKLPVKISTYDEAIEIPFVGERLAAKIEEIVLTGRLLRLENAELEPEDLVLQLFLKIYGVGTQEASNFIKAGYKTLDDLRTKARLTKGQKIGLDHYDDFNTRIPRDEVTALGAIVKGAIKLIDPEVEAIIGGSYRRGAPTSGDIDFILTKPGTDCSEDLLPFLYTLVDRLTHDGFLTAALATPSRSRDDSGSKWHGACVLPSNPIWRRIDFLLVPETQLGAALIYFTGDDIFNRSLRLLARHMGYGLNQRGLYKNVSRGHGGKKISDGELVEGRDEREIFHLLGVPWRIPEHRICH